MTFAIATDTSANLPTELLQKDAITVIPFSYFIDEQEFTCLDESGFNGEAYYQMIRAGKRVTTAQINPQRYLEKLTPILARGQDLLFVGMSSGISGSFHCAQMAAAQLREEFPERRICVIDTLGASLGEGLLVLKAAELRAQGMSLTGVPHQLMRMRERMYQVFTVDDLLHLRRSGRLSNAAAVVGTVLQIKPLLKGNEKGQIVSFAKLRGRKRAVAALAEKYDALVEHAEEQIVGIAHADCPEDAEALAELLKKNHPPKQILNVVYEPVTGSHVGPGTLALFFLGGEGVRGK